ncbi:olfactory receptor 8J3 [Prionailurus iriomotensis]
MESLRPPRAPDSTLLCFPGDLWVDRGREPGHHHPHQC